MIAALWWIYGLVAFALLVRVGLGIFTWCMQGVGTVTAKDRILLRRTPLYALMLVLWLLVPGPLFLVPWVLR